MAVSNVHRARPFFFFSLFILILLAPGCGKRASVNQIPFTPSAIKFIDIPELVRFDEGEDSSRLIGEATIGNDTRPVFKLGRTKKLQVTIPRDFPSGFKYYFTVGFSDEAHLHADEIFLTLKFLPAQQMVDELKSKVATKGFWTPRWQDTSGEILVPIKAGSTMEFEISGLDERASDDDFFLSGPVIYGERETGSPTRIFLIAVDTLRADHLGCYGYERGTSPNVDSFANDAALFERCISTSPWTYPSFGAMFTGNYPSVAGAVTNVKFLQEGELTLAEVLSSYGFATFSVVNNPWVGTTTNLDQGFDVTIEYPHERASKSFTKALEWSGKHADEDQFVFIHLMDPHLPYKPKPENTGRFRPDDYSGKYSDEFEMIPRDIEALREGNIEISPEDRKRIAGLYDEEIVGFDQDFAAFIAQLKSKDMYDDSVIILTSDHGEEFWEHGAFEHGHQLYDEVLHVPLIVRGAGFAEGKRYDELCSQMDIFPTLLMYLGVGSSYEVNGFPLQVITEKTYNDSNRYLLSEQLFYGVEQRGVTTSEYRYIFHTIDSTEELYDWKVDPGMNENLAQDRRKSSRELRYLVKEYMLSGGSGWHIRFARNSSSVYGKEYILRIFSAAGFKSVIGHGFEESDDIQQQADSLFINVSLDVGEEKTIAFSTPDEDTEVLFELTVDGEREHRDVVFIGPDKEPFPSNLFILKITDERFGLGVPNFRKGQYPGLYIWGNSLSLGEELSPEISDEVREELKSLGYLN